MPPVDKDVSFVILAEGDSITSGQGATDGLGSYVDRAASFIHVPYEAAIRAKSQSNLGWPDNTTPTNSLFARITSDNALIPPDKAGRVYVLSILVGRNDLVGNYGGIDAYLGNLTTYIATMRKAGWDRVVLGTLLPSEWEPFVPVRHEFNARIKSDCWAAKNGVDVIADFAASPEMGSDKASSDKTYYVDGTHPSNSGYEVMAPIWADAINRLKP